MGAVTYSALRKFNPYHDARGRFTTKGGGSGGGYKAITAGQAAKMRDQMHPDLDYFSDDTMRLKDQKNGYIGTRNSMVINKALRNGAELTEEQQKTVGVMDRNMQPLPQGVNVVRFANDGFLSALGVDDATDSIDSIRERLVGGTVTDGGYVSTSYDAAQNKMAWRNNVQIDLSVPKGTKALISPNDDEAEIVLHRGTSFRIDSVESNGKRPLAMDYKIIIKGTVIEQ